MGFLRFLFDFIKTLIAFIICAIILGIIYYNLNLPLLPAIVCPIFVSLADKFNVNSLKILAVFACLLGVYGVLWYGIVIWGTIAYYPAYGNWLAIILNIPTLLAFLSYAFTLPIQILTLKY